MSGFMGGADLSATSWATVYTVTTGKLFTGTINFCNRGAVLAKVRLGFTESASPGVTEYVEYDFPLTPAGTTGSGYERSGVVLDADKKVMAYSDVANVSVVVLGYEE